MSATELYGLYCMDPSTDDMLHVAACDPHQTIGMGLEFAGSNNSYQDMNPCMQVILLVFSSNGRARP